MPTVTVVIATRNRERRLAAMLASLREQTFTDFEVMVVDDGSTDGTAALLAAERARGDLALEHLRHEASRGPAAARNAGWRRGRGALVAFTDDDCEASPGWLEAGVRAWEGHDARVVQGQVQPIAAERHRLGAFSYSIVVEGPTPSFETANVFYPRALLERLGGFDETFRRPAGEDADLGWRAMAAGAQQWYAADALVEHAVLELSPAQLVRRHWNWQDAVAPFARHAGLRETLHLRIFWNWSHYLLLRALLALPLLRRRWGWPVALWLGGRFVAYEVQRSRQVTGTPWLAPVWMATDAVELAACARGSLRYRVLVL